MATAATAHRRRAPADVYDEDFVPALFAQWSEEVSQLAGITTGHRVLDVACGTGALACAAARCVGANGKVAGVDPNEEMLAVARRKPETVEWITGCAEELPFPAAHFDRVVSQFGLMFFRDRVRALREMMRVLRPGGRLAVAVCDAVDRSPGYAVFAELLQRLFGADVAESFRAPFVLGDEAQLLNLCREADIDGEVVSRNGTVRFPSAASLVATEGACVWTLGGLLDAAQLEQLRAQTELALRPFVTAAGTLEFPMPALVITATRT